MNAGSEEARKLWEEINSLTHIGRSASDIEQALLARGYDKPMLKEILTPSFIESFIGKEDMFLHLQHTANDRAAKLAENDELEAMKRKSQEQLEQKQKMEEELSRQDEEHIAHMEDEKKQADLQDLKDVESVKAAEDGQEQESGKELSRKTIMNRKKSVYGIWSNN